MNTKYVPDSGRGNMPPCGHALGNPATVTSSLTPTRKGVPTTLVT